MFATKIPPPFYAAVAGLIIWTAPDLFPPLEIMKPPFVWTGWPLIVLGTVLDLMAFSTFRRYRTTINPIYPARATTVVTRGPYRFSRNPMYLGLVLVLFGLSLLRGAPVCGVFAALFALLVAELQIKPEERALETKFGTAYREYAKTVPRWFRWRT